MPETRRYIVSPSSIGIGSFGVDKNKNLWFRVSDREYIHVSGTSGSIVRVIGGPGGRVVIPSANDTSPATPLDAGDLITNTSAFGVLLSATDDTVQDALDTLDDHVHVHSTNTSLTADDHTQYLLLLGRAGGQTAYGGTAASENLTLESTAHATKGEIELLSQLLLAAGNTTWGPVRFQSGPLRTITQVGLIEFLTDRFYAGISTPSGAFTSQYPPAQNDTYVKATSTQTANYYPYFATDPTKSLTGSYVGNAWLSTIAVVTNQRFHIDLGSAKIITRIYYENLHTSGGGVTGGVKAFTLWGSNSASAFAELTYGTDTNWTQLATSASQFDIHVSADTVDPKVIIVTNSESYRYYALKIATNWGNANNLGFRRLELQSSDDPLVRKIFVLTDDSVTGLTSGRVPYCTTDGRLVDYSGFTFNGTRLTTLVTLIAGTASAAAFIFPSGVVLTTPAAGAEEADSTRRYWTNAAVARKTYAWLTDPIDTLGAPTDVTTLNASNGAHGLLPKLGGGSTNFLRADGTWNDPLTGGLSATKNFTTAEGAHEVVIANGLITSWTITP